MWPPILRLKVCVVLEAAMMWHGLSVGTNSVPAVKAWVLSTACLVGLGLASPVFGQQSTRAGSEWFRADPTLVPAATPTPAPAPPAAPVPPAAPAVDPNFNPGLNMPPQPPLAPLPALDPNRRPYRMPGLGGGYGGGYGSVSGLYPSSEMNSYVVASARAAMARSLFYQADSELGQAYRAAQRQFDASLEYKQAIKDERDAYSDLGFARSKAFSSLSEDKKYQRLLALRQDLSERLEDGRARHTLTPDEVVAMANLKMSYATEMRSIEVGALANEPSVRQSQDRLVSAGSHVSALRQSFDESVRVNPDILMARRNLEDARIAKLTADAYLRAATMNSSYAMDYAYYLYRRPNNGYTDAFSSAGRY